jgi:hypothetical protein
VRIRRVRAAVLSFLLSVAISGCRTVDSGLHTARLPCGLYRWPVKTLTDLDAASVHWTPIDTTLRHLVALPRPESVHRKRRTTYEFYVFRVQAVLVAVHTMVDQDLHLLLQDPDDPKVRMIAEVPSPLCASGTAQTSAYAAARRVAVSLRRRGRAEGALVEVTGIGFFDALHKRGSSHTGVELHPVLQIAVVEREQNPEVVSSRAP